MKKHEYLAPQPIDKKKQARVLITTDLEVDDMNGIMLTLMYATDYDIAGIVWTAGMFHFNGDGEHTLGEVTPHYRCKATHVNHTVENAGQLKDFRPADPHFLERIIDVNYRHDYKMLSKNNPNYPTPEYLLSVTKTGNVAFEGDYRFETEGSNWIKECILDDDMRPLYIQHWGGINTTVRAFYSIYEEYHDTDQWDAVLAKVIAKVRLQGDGEDYCRADSKLDEMFPGLIDGGRAWADGFGYANFFAAADMGENASPMFRTPPEVKKYYKAEWLIDAFKFNHGAIMSRFYLMDDGQPIYGEPYGYQYGLHGVFDWGGMADEGFDNDTVKNFPRVEIKRMDWMCCQFETSMFVDIGLRVGIRARNPHYTQVLFEELAARADWAIMEPEFCNHAPVVVADQLDFTAAAGADVKLSAAVSDPDGDTLTINWWMAENEQKYEGEGYGIEAGNVTEATFTVPADAKAGDRFVINMEVSDDAERKMTRFAEFTVTVA